MAVEFIEFDDKETHVAHPEIPANQKYVAADVNEIKAVVNNNAEELESIVSMADGSGFYVSEDGKGNIGKDPEDTEEGTKGELTQPLSLILKDGNNSGSLSIQNDLVNLNASETFEPGTEDEYMLSSEVSLYPDHFFMAANREVGVQSIEATPEETLLITDSANEKGIEYADDYSVNYTNRSLVDKEYADRVSGSAIETFSDADYTVTRSCTLRFTGSGTFNAVLPVQGTIPGLSVLLMNEGSANANFLVLSGGLTIKNQAASGANTLAVAPNEVVELKDNGTFYRVINKY